MLTGHLYLSSELSGGVFDEASRSMNEAKEMIAALLPYDDSSMVCAWVQNKV